MRALQTDMDTIAVMKDQKMQLEERAKLEAEKYIEEVEELTRNSAKDESEDNGAGSLRLN